jgi:inhibitor of KinA
MRPAIRKFGDSAVLFEWNRDINDIDYTALLSFESNLLESHGDEILETVIAYTSLAAYLREGVDMDAFIENFDTEFETEFQYENKAKTWLIPVCYSSEFGIDIDEVAKHTNLSEKDVVQLHTSVEYRVRFIGFLPGFPYLSGLDHRLFTPRRSQPRKLIHSGSVGIGGAQTGIYTMESPGGWNIIGRSPLQFFDIARTPPALIVPGDSIRFKSIESDVYKAISHEVANGTYNLESAKYD